LEPTGSNEPDWSEVTQPEATSDLADEVDAVFDRLPIGGFSR
jgi:hypothetical protein